MSKRKKILTIAVCAVFGLLLLTAAACRIALSSTVICSRWLPMAGRMTNSSISASEVNLSLLRNSLEIKDFFYADSSGFELRIDSLNTRIAFFRLLSKDFRIDAPALQGVRIKFRQAAGKAAIPAPARKPAGIPPPSVTKEPLPHPGDGRIPLMNNIRIPESILGWKAQPFKVALRDLVIRDLAVDYAGADGTELNYALESLTLNRIGPGMFSELRLDSILTASRKKTGVEIRSLPLSLVCKMLLDSSLFPESLELSVDSRAESPAALLVPAASPKVPLALERMRFLVRGKRRAGKWTLEQGLFSMGKSSLKASGELEPRLNHASLDWTLKLYPGQFPEPLPGVIRKSGMDIAYLEESGKLLFRNGRLDISGSLAGTGFKLDGKGVAADDLRAAMNYIFGADIPGGTFVLSNAMLDVSAGKNSLISLQSKTPLKFYRTREGVFPDPATVPNLQFRLREMALSNLNIFLNGKKFRKGAAELSAALTADEARNILLTAHMLVREKHKGGTAAEITMDARINLADNSRPDSIRLASRKIDIPLLRDIFSLEEPVSASDPEAVVSAPSASSRREPSAAVRADPQLPPSPPSRAASVPSASAQESPALAGRLPAFLRSRDIEVFFDLKNMCCASDVSLALAGKTAFRKCLLSADRMLLRINGTDFPLNFEANLADGRCRAEGMTKGLNAGPLVNLFLTRKTAALKVDSLKFELSASGFTPDRIRQTLTGTFVAGVSGISLPLELDQSSDLFQLVMLPLENIPSLLGMIGGGELKNLALEKTRGLASILSGDSALCFSSGNLDASFRAGVMTLKDLTLTGDPVLTETLLGTVNLATGGIDLKTRTGLDVITIPLNFKGTITSPVPDFTSGISDFLKLNAAAPLQKTVDRLLNSALNVSETEAEALENDENVLDKAIDKGIRNGLRSLDKWLNRRNGRQ